MNVFTENINLIEIIIIQTQLLHTIIEIDSSY